MHFEHYYLQVISKTLTLWKHNEKKMGSQMRTDMGTMSTANLPRLLQAPLFNISLFFPQLYMSRKFYIVVDIPLHVLLFLYRKQSLRFMQMGLRDFRTAVLTRQSCLADYSCQGGQLLERSHTNILTPQDCLDSIWMGNQKLQNLYHKKKKENMN